MLPQHLWRIWRFARLPRSLLAVAWRSNISIGGISDDLCDCERELTIRTMSPPLPPPARQPFRPLFPFVRLLRVASSRSSRRFYAAFPLC